MLNNNCFDFKIDDDLDCVHMEDKFVKEVSVELNSE